MHFANRDDNRDANCELTVMQCTVNRETTMQTAKWDENWETAMQNCKSMMKTGKLRCKREKVG